MNNNSQDFNEEMSDDNTIGRDL